jgi:hypothetical protein
MATSRGLRSSVGDDKKGLSTESTRSLSGEYLSALFEELAKADAALSSCKQNEAADRRSGQSGRFPRCRDQSALLGRSRSL